MNVMKCFVRVVRYPNLRSPLCTPFPTDAHPLPAEMRFQRSDSIVGSPTRACYHGRSRLETEFEELENLGSGGFGDVFKVCFPELDRETAFICVRVCVGRGG